MIRLDLPFLVWLNQYMVLRFGGTFFSSGGNVRNRDSLEYLVEFLRECPFDETSDPPVYCLAAEYAHRIITRHVFHDGNKRTGMEAMLVCLRANGVTLTIDSLSDDLQTMGLAIAEGNADVSDIVLWIKEHADIPYGR